MYAQEQLGHTTIELTVSTYGRWLKKKAPGALDRLDSEAEVGSGSKMMAKAGLVAKPALTPTSKSRIFKHLRWSRRPGFNGRPAVYETAALQLSSLDAACFVMSLACAALRLAPRKLLE